MSLASHSSLLQKRDLFMTSINSCFSILNVLSLILSSHSQNSSTIRLIPFTLILLILSIYFLSTESKLSLSILSASANFLKEYSFFKEAINSNTFSMLFLWICNFFMIFCFLTAVVSLVFRMDLVCLTSDIVFVISFSVLMMLLM